ncbi:MAG: OsmC family protein [Clostridiales bacterium]|nr:OsmC family protein [Clostridiales bacterium]
MATRKIEMNFSNTFEGEMIAPKGTVKIGVEEGTIEPYDLLFGSLGSCVYSTFLDIVNKKKAVFDHAEVIVTGEKRKEVPTTLKWCKVEFVIYGSTDEKGLTKAGELAAKYCSIYTTLAHVAEMSLEVTFK